MLPLHELEHQYQAAQTATKVHSYSKREWQQSCPSHPYFIFIFSILQNQAQSLSRNGHLSLPVQDTWIIYPHVIVLSIPVTDLHGFHVYLKASRRSYIPWNMLINKTSFWRHFKSYYNKTMENKAQYSDKASDSLWSTPNAYSDNRRNWKYVTFHATKCKHYPMTGKKQHAGCTEITTTHGDTEHSSPTVLALGNHIELERPAQRINKPNQPTVRKGEEQEEEIKSSDRQKVHLESTNIIDAGKQKNNKTQQSGPEYSSDVAGDGPKLNKSIKVATLNCNSLGIGKFHTSVPEIMRLIHNQKLDIISLLDTRIPGDEKHFLYKELRRTLQKGIKGQSIPGMGNNVVMVISPAKQASPSDHHWIGGQITIMRPEFHNCITNHQTDKTDVSIISTIQLCINGGKLRLISIYVPSNSHGPDSLLVKANSKLHALHYKGSAYTYIREKLGQLCSGEEPVIVMGDFNATWSDKNNPLHLEDLATTIGLIRVNQDSDKTFHRGGKLISTIDHILTTNNAALTVDDCYTDDSIMSISDHLPLIGEFRLCTYKTSGKIIKKQDTDKIRQQLFKVSYLDIDPHNQELVDQFQCGILEISDKLNSDKIQGRINNEQLLEQISLASSRLVRQLLKPISKKRRSGDNFCAASVVFLQQHLKFMVKVQQTCMSTQTEITVESIQQAQAKHRYNLNYNLAPLRIKDSDAVWIQNQCNIATSGTPTEQMAQGITHVQQLLRNRNQHEQLCRTKTFIKQREERYKSGRIGQVINSLTEKFNSEYDMDSIQLDNGNTIIDPRDIHATHTTHWRRWFAGDHDPTELRISTSFEDTRDFQTFANTIQAHNIPIHIQHAIWKGIRTTENETSNIRQRVRTRLQETLESPPTLKEFSRTISQLPNKSAPGISGLTYNQIKLWPQGTLVVVHKALSATWTDKTQPTFYKYKWLVPLSKLKGPGNPTLLQLRPIMLIEALRKIWSSMIIKRIRYVMEEQQALAPNQYGFRQHRSTSQPLMQFTAALEQTAEVGGTITGSTWDVVRAFDSIAKSLLQLSMDRIGVPPEWIRYLIQSDEDSRILVRTPWAECWIRRKGTARTNNLSTKDTLISPNHFHALRGVGQGDVGSPTLWIFFMDILLCSLNEMQYSPIYLQRLDGSLFPTHDTAFADDLLSLSSHTLQPQADIVSAFCNIMQVDVAVSKLRSFTIDYGEPTGETNLTLYNKQWEPSNSNILREGIIPYLGLLIDISSQYRKEHHATQFKTIISKTKAALGTISRKRITGNAKIMVANMCIISRVAYVGTFCSWDIKKYHQLDTIFRIFYRKVLHHLPSFPNALLYASTKHMGLGLRSVTDIINQRKLNLLNRLQHGDSHSRDIGSALVGRAARLARITPYQRGRIILPAVPTQEYWLLSILQWLDTKHLHMAYRNQLVADITMLPAQTRQTEWAMHLNLLNTHDISVKSIHEEYRSLIPDHLMNLRMPKSSTVHHKTKKFIQISAPELDGLELPSWDIPLLEGQCWLLHPDNMDEHQPFQIAEILSILLTEDQLHVHIWGSTYKGSYPYHDNIQGDTVTLETPIQGAGSGHIIPLGDILGEYSCKFILSSDCRHVAGITRKILLSSLEHPILTRYAPTSWIPTELAEQLQQIQNPIIFTDGSYTANKSIMQHLRIDKVKAKASAGIIIMSNLPDWHNRPTIGIHIELSEQYRSSFLAELAGLAIGAKIQQQLRPDNDRTEIMSDSKSAIDTIQHKAFKNNKPGAALIATCAASLGTESNQLKFTRSHAEKRMGPYSILDHGNIWADHYASNNITRQCTYSHVLDPHSLNSIDEQRIHIYRDTGEILLQPISEISQEIYFTNYIQDRDRESRHQMGSWQSTSTGLCNQIWGNKGMVKRAQAQRVVFDKLMHPCHPSIPLADNICSFCGEKSTLDHIIRHCQQPELKDHRKNVLDTAEQATQLMSHPTKQLCMELLHMASSGPPQNLRLWTGLWNQDITDHIWDCITPILNTEHETTIFNARPSMIIFLRILAEGLLHIWQIWTAFVLPTNETILARHKVTPKQMVQKQQTISKFSMDISQLNQLTELRHRRQKQDQAHIPRNTKFSTPNAITDNGQSGNEFKETKRQKMADKETTKRISEYFQKINISPSISSDPALPGSSTSTLLSPQTFHTSRAGIG